MANMSWAQRRLRGLRELRRAVAYHEAGHAVAARLLDVTITETKFSLERDEPSIHVQTRSAGDAARGTPGFRKGLEADIQVALAGGIAQQLYSPQSYHESQVEDDNQAAASAAIRHCLEPSNGEMGSAFHFEGKVPAEAADLLNRLHEATVNLIRENWHKVERVAAAFLKHSELTQADIDAVMMQPA
jgi:hypothetical protein